MQYQHGDVLIERVGEIPMTAKKQKTKSIVLAEGEVTGHTHVVTTPGVESFVEDAMMYIKSIIPWEVRHEEHGPIEIPPGIYKIGRVREYDHIAEMERIVRD